MKPKTRFNLASLIIVMLILSLSIILMKERYNYKEKIKNSLQDQHPSPILNPECSAGEKKQCISNEGYQGYMPCENGAYSQKCFIASLDDCKITIGKLSAVCCKDKSGLIYDCNEKTNFKPSDYVIIKTNLQMVLQQSSVNLDTYKACAFSNLITAESEVPEHYKPDTMFYTPTVGCSRAFDAKDFHQAVFAGFVPEASSRIVLSEVRVYPANTVLANSQDAENNKGISTSVFKFEVNVGE